MRKNEKGMALIVAIFVTIFLLFISVAFFTSSRNVVNSSRQNWANLVSCEISEGGAERAVWFVQSKLDADSTWLPSTSTSSVLVWGDYDNFVKNYGDERYKYADYGVKLVGTKTINSSNEQQSSQIYAVKMVQKDDPNTEAEEWLICSAGATRFALSDKGSAKEIKGMEILVRLGRIEEGNPKFPAMYDGAELVGETRKILNNPYFHLEAMKDGQSVPAEIYTEARWTNTIDGQTNLGNRNSSGRTGYAKESSIIFKEAPTVANEMTSNATWNALINNTGIKVESVPKMDFPEIDFDVFKNGKGDIQRCDYSASDLVGLGLWEDKGDYYQPKKRMMYLATKDSSVISLSGGDVYKDINRDGYTVIYTDKGFKFGTQNCGKIFIENGAHGVILSEGSFTSTGNKNYGNSQNTISTVGVEIQGEINSVGGMKLETGILQGGNQALADYKFGVKYLNMKEDGEYNVYGLYGSANFLNCVWEDKNGNRVSVPSEKWGEPLWSDDVGVLDILSTNNVIISNSYGNKEEGVSRFRGSIYSKNKLFLQADLAMRGAIAGKKGVIRINQWDNGLVNGSYGGYDFVELYENPMDREGESISIPRNAVTGSGGSSVNKRQIALLAWNTKVGK